MDKRVKFATNWLQFVQKNRWIIGSKFLVLWKELVKRYPFLECAYRRYLTEPQGLIHNIAHIDEEIVISTVKGSVEKDFSLRDKIMFLKRYKSFNAFVKPIKPRKK